LKKFLAVIPVREKSSRLKNKNVKKILGHELFLWTYQYAKDSKLIDKVIISSESKKIMKIANNYGYSENYLRNKNLAKKNVRNISTVLDVLDYEEKNGRFYDYVILLHATSPIRLKNRLDFSLKKFLKSKCNSGVSLSEGTTKKDNFIGVIKKNKFILQKNNFFRKQLFFYNASTYITKCSLLKKNKTFINKAIFPIVQSHAESVDINYQKDFDFAKILMQSKKYMISIPKKI
jgi:CMP-N,N'-diacetyllegionaminic acid synthase